jgi:hypothetical protein
VARVVCALTLVVAWPLGARAAWLGFRNDTGVPIVVQSGSPTRAGMRWSKAHGLYQGEVSWDSVVQKGARVIVIFDAKRRPVGKAQINCGDDDQCFSVQVTRVRGQVAVQLVPAKSPQGKRKPSR